MNRYIVDIIVINIIIESGSVDFDEFVTMVNKNVNHLEEEASKVFQSIDTDKDGVISIVELKSYLTTNFEDSPDGEIQSLFEFIDTNKTGYIEFIGNY